MLKDYKDQIQDADLVLVGIGRELRADRVIDFKKAITNEHYQNLIDKEDEDSKWMRTVYEREYLLSMKETDLFKELEEVLEGKEYFVVTSNDDGLLYHPPPCRCILFSPRCANIVRSRQAQALSGAAEAWSPAAQQHPRSRYGKTP